MLIFVRVRFFYLTQYYLFNLILFVMVRIYELHKRSGFRNVLRCESRRFLRDVACCLSYDFGDGTFKVHFPQSWLSIEVSEEFRKFSELVRSPNWYSEIQPQLVRYGFNGDELF